jgi:peptidoglycan/xylan/chitin deacetylase (PgdA/CDA1 family)
MLLSAWTLGPVAATLAQDPGGQLFRWPDGKKAAVCLTYDDGIDCHLDVAAPALERYHFRGTFYIPGHSVSLCERTEEWRALASRGHELGNHTLFHPCDGERFHWVMPEYDLNNYTFDRLMKELRTANTLLKAVDGLEIRTFAYTCTDYTIDGVSFIDSVRILFPAARGGGPVPESMEELDPCYVPSWGVIDPTGDELIAYVKDALARGTMAVFMFHSVGGGYLNVSAEAHEKLLEYLHQNRDVIWTDTFLHVMDYVNTVSGSRQ